MGGIMLLPEAARGEERSLRQGRTYREPGGAADPPLIPPGG
jgi:hypothetical protein